MTQKRIKLIPAIHGKLTRDGKLSEPDIHAIMDRWLKRHPEMLGREREMRISRSRRRLANGIWTKKMSDSTTASA